MYEVGWLEKPAGQTRAALELNTQAERAAQTKAFAKAKFDEAEQALQQRDLTAARKLIDEADAADPNQAAMINLRGEILLAAKGIRAGGERVPQGAESGSEVPRRAIQSRAGAVQEEGIRQGARSFRGALQPPPPGADKDRAAQLIKFKIYLTLLLEGKDSRAQKMMEQFQFTGDTPALYYAQAAWEFKHDNPTKANDWVTSARKIYPLALQRRFCRFILRSRLAAGCQRWQPRRRWPSAEVAQPEAAPSIEPTPDSRA